MRTIVVMAFLLLGLPMAAQAQEKMLNGDEITAALAGNTVTGEQKGVAWKQYFDATGATTYINGSDAPTEGLWKVEGGKFCSQWPPRAQWDCYDMTGQADDVAWIYQGGDPLPAKVVSGNQLGN